MQKRPEDIAMYDDLVDNLLKVQGLDLYRIILYGSTARGDNEPDSDIDIAIIVTSALNETEEDELSDRIVDLNLKYEKVFSVIDINLDHYENWKNVIPFYKNVDNEGIVLWQAA